jgi:hypothetical protein
MHAGNKCKILFLAANPLHEDRLALPQEMRQIEQAVRLGPHRDDFVLVSYHAVRPADLQQALLVHRPDVVHISSHGREQAGVSLEDDDGSALPVGPEALARLFAALPMPIQLVVLNACDSMAMARAIRPHVNVVIGMDGVLGDESAIHFSSAFYRALVHGESVASALELARVEIGLHGLLEHSVPSIVSRPGADPSAMRFAPRPGDVHEALLTPSEPGNPAMDRSIRLPAAIAGLLQVGCFLAAFWLAPGFRETMLLQAVLLLGISAVTWRQLQQSKHYRFIAYVLVMVFFTYAPVALNAERYYGLLVEHSRELKHYFPKASIASYAFIRGTGSMAWAIPLMLYLFWHLTGDRHKNLPHLWGKCLYLCLLLQTMSIGMVFYYDSVLARAMASAEGAGPFAPQVEDSQRGYLIASVVCFCCGYGTLLAVRRERKEDGLMLLVITSALVVQIGYWFSQHYAARLNMQAPALRKLDDAGKAYRSADGQLVYTSSYFNDLGSSHLRQWQPFSVCLHPASGQFEFAVLPKSVFLARYQPVNSELLVATDYFCAPSPER